ncbi:MAG TPA: DUF4279 domain-containing protein [Phycisphaerae bacterium]|nr:DUF4279 domain-containing protein [Phycisphaerae bacterium]
MSVRIAVGGKLYVPKRIFDHAHASVRFYGSALDPLTVKLALRLPADRTHRDGEPRLGRTRKGKVMEYSPYRGGMWAMTSERWVKSPRLSVHLEWLLSQLEPKAKAIAALRREGVNIDFFCFSSGSTPHPPSLPRTIRQRATALGIRIDIDHYVASTTERL